ncbi:tripartite tricarboxylate transporter TctB family protein [Jiella sp. M17.18]|uniref:tripartite tricarboxylate transporter TctB family protein n=1 Tax=Jiella sp. M17.18 TaxID=3234247 RepID=UPI0034DEB2CA
MMGAGFVTFVMAEELPAMPSTGDVGAGFMPEIVGAAQILLALVYLANVLRGRDRASGLFSVRSLLLFLIFIGVAVATPWLGLPVAAGLGAFAGVVYAEGGKRWALAALTGFAFWALTQIGFGWLLDVPLP